MLAGGIVGTNGVVDPSPCQKLTHFSCSQAPLGHLALSPLGHRVSSQGGAFGGATMDLGGMSIGVVLAVAAMLYVALGK